MNRSLLTSIHAVVVLGIAVGLAALPIVFGFALGRGADASRDYLIWTGWVALALFTVAYAYVLRKYAHKLGYSFEFGRQVSRAAMEAAEKELGILRDRVASKALTDRAEIKRQARLVLVNTGCSRVLRIDLEKDATGGTVLVKRRTEPLGRTARWMHAHLYYGAGAGVVTFLHGGGSFASPMGILLNGLTALVVGTGFVGLGFWLWGPKWLTKQEADLSTEEAFALDRHYTRRIRAALKQNEDGTDVDPDDDAEETMSITRAIKPVRAKDLARLTESARADGAEREQDIATLIGQHRRVRAELERLQRAKFTMNAWRVVHVPASIVLLAVIVAHVVSVWFY